MIAFDSGLVYNSMECKHVQVSAGLQARIIERKSKREVQEILEQVLTEAEKIFLIVKDFCVENYIEVLIGMNALALLLAIIGIAKARKALKESRKNEAIEATAQSAPMAQAEPNEQVAPADPVEAFEQAEPANPAAQTENQGAPAFNFSIEGDDKATLRLNIERADICIANVERINRQFEDKLVSESTPETASEAAMAEIQELHEAAEAAGLGEDTKPSEPAAKAEQDMQGDGMNVFVQAADTQPAEPIVIEKLIPIETEKINPGKFYTSKSGIVYSEEEIASKIKD